MKALRLCQLVVAASYVICFFAILAHSWPLPSAVKYIVLAALAPAVLYMLVYSFRKDR